MASTYSFVRLTNVDGEKHDFIFENRVMAQVRFNSYVNQAKLDKLKYGDDAAITSTDCYVRVAIKLRYGLKCVAEISWKAEVHFNESFCVT